MPNIKYKRRHARDKSLLSEVQRLDLVIGPWDSNTFANEAERKAAWLRHREEILLLDPLPHAMIVYELGGFLPEEGDRISLAAKRLGLKYY